MSRIALCTALTALLSCVPFADAQIFLNADTPATGSTILSTPLVTPYGTISFVGELFSPASDPEFIAAGAAGAVFDGIGSPANATLTFSFEVNAITLIYGGNAGSINLEARDIGGGIVDSFFQASTSGGTPAGPITLSGNSIRSLFWTDSSGSYVAIDNVTIDVGVSCTLTGPVAPASGPINLALDSTSASASMVDATFEYSLDGGATYLQCTADATSPIPNPALGIPEGMQTFVWNSQADGVGTVAIAIGVIARATVGDGVATTPAVCATAPFDVDNVPPPPTCTLTGPVGIASGSIAALLDSASVSAGAVDAVFEFSLDGGATFMQCTAAPGSALANPAVAVPTGAATFTWDSAADAVGAVAVVTGVVLRATIDDGVAPATGECLSAPFDVDNTALCGGICGDCNIGSTGPDIIDALTAAQIAVALVVPTTEQTGCCDVNSSLVIDVIDALFIAQASAGLPVVLICP